jgi:hypothetical protein
VAFFMSRMLRILTMHFQGLTQPSGNSTQHERDTIWAPRPLSATGPMVGV